MTQWNESRRDGGQADSSSVHFQQLLAARREGALTRLAEHLKNFGQLYPDLFSDQIQTLRVKIDIAIDTALNLEKKEG